MIGIVTRAALQSTVVVVVLAAATHAYALDPDRTLSQYVHRIWQVQQGLPEASIYAIVQTHDGYLWLGTQTGLVKFDGVRFTTVDAVGGVSIGNVWVTHLVQDQEGALWVGTDHDGVIELRHGAATRYTTREGLPSDSVRCLLTDLRGTVWICTPSGVAALTRSTVRTFPAAGAWSTANIRAACATPAGSVVVGTDEGQIADFDGAVFHPRRLRLESGAALQAMLCSADGRVWIGTSRGLLRLQGEEDKRLTHADGLANDSIVSLAETPDGAIFAGTMDGFSRLRGDDIDSFHAQDGLSQSTVYSVYEDRERTLWVATKHGLNQFLDGRAVPYTTSEGLPSNATGPLVEDRGGTMWIGTLGGGLA